MVKRRINTFKHLLLCGWNGVLDLFYPHICIGCGSSLNNRKIILCNKCATHLPRTEHAWQRGNNVEQLFEDIPLTHSLVRGGAFCYYEYGSFFRTVIHRFKYAKQPQIGKYLATLAAQEWDKHNFFADIDLLVPVPLHKKKLGKRSYNQAEIICNGLADIVGITVDTTHLTRVVNNASQTQKTAEERKHNTQGIFTLLHPEDWQGKHILLVDDIITTGATLRACIETMKSIRALRVSIFCLGIARIPIIIE